MSDKEERLKAVADKSLQAWSEKHASSHFELGLLNLIRTFKMDYVVNRLRAEANHLEEFVRGDGKIQGT